MGDDVLDIETAEDIYTASVGVVVDGMDEVTAKTTLAIMAGLSPEHFSLAVLLATTLFA